jgi:protein TonB
MFDEVLKAVVARREIPARTVEFRQRDRALFGGMVGRDGVPPPAGAVALGPDGRPLVVPVLQADRRLFDRIVTGAETPEPPPLDAVPGAFAIAVPFGPGSRDYFRAIVAHDLGRRAARRGAWSLGATAFQTLLIALMAFVTAHLAAFVTSEPEALPVQIVAPRVARAGPRGLPPPPPAAPMGARRSAPLRPRPAGYKPPAPTALLQPREVQAVMKAPGPGEAGEDLEYGFVGEEEGGVVGGVVGGVPGGVVGGVLGGAVGGDGGGIEEAPRYATAGFRRPAEAEPGCVRRSVRIPSDLAGYVSGPLTVKFGVQRDGSVGAVQVLAEGMDLRIVEAIRRAVRGCRWIAGADARGQAVAIWVILPLRFEGD